MTRSGGPSPAEHHLGDRLAALVDGELGHDARERVLAHLATCPRCKAEADAQRQVKSLFARTAAPPPSESLLARLHNLPAAALDGDDDDRDGRPGGGDRLFGGPGVFGAREEAFAFLPTPPRERGFRIHEVTRPSPRGRRFAFAAAGAVSLAAFALSGALPLGTSVDPSRNRAGGAGAAVTPPPARDAAAAAWHPGVHRADMGLLALSGLATGGADGRTGTRGPVTTPAPAATVAPQTLLQAYRASGLPVSSVLPPVMRPALAVGTALRPGVAAPEPAPAASPAQAVGETGSLVAAATGSD
ncbi:zf-HC2 domain-containing protein [Streptomyces sp. NPDC018031]|uniref:zf-HC2 domain-containing protein n=1 Tax=Streptomyces sp. NPDC018031 TaxID=3365033 RepID=UPI0037BDC909